MIEASLVGEVRNMTSAAPLQEVRDTARALGWTVELSSLAQPEASSSNKGLEADEEAQINMLHEALSSQLRQPIQEPQRKAVLACLQVCAYSAGTKKSCAPERYSFS